MMLEPVDGLGVGSICPTSVVGYCVNRGETTVSVVSAMDYRLPSVASAVLSKLYTYSCEALSELVPACPGGSR
jgi:hypothetical protein